MAQVVTDIGEYPDERRQDVGTPGPIPLKVVVDSASLITAAKFTVDGHTVVEHLAHCCLLRIPPAVHNEVILAGATYPDAAHVQALVRDSYITVASPPVSDASVLDGYKLGRGEKESIILTLTLPDTDYLVVDDRLAFVVSDRMTVPKILLVDLLVELVWKGFMERLLVEKILGAIAPRYAPGFIPHTLTMLERGERRCLT
jgi:predicted nucleic acid-binding protein